jgi:uncharacterized protein
MDPFALLARHYEPASLAHRVLVVHSVLVARKAREIAGALRRRRPGAALDLEFVVEAALLHDIGIGRCQAPEIGCTGPEPYIRHGVIGRELLEAAGLPCHALVCERHTGAGIPREEVRAAGLPLPERDYLPLSLEEKVICVADKFYSKKPARLWEEKSIAEIERRLAKWGPAVLERWRALRAEVLG